MSGSYDPYPPAPPPYGGWQAPPAARGPRPSTVTAAFALMLLQSALSVVSLVITFSNKDQIKQKVLDNTPSASQATLNSVIDVAIGVAVVFLVLYLALAFVVRAGKNWARIVTWVLAGLGVLSLLVSLAQPTVGAGRVVSVLAGLIDIVLIVVLALRPSNEWFRSRPPQYR